MANGWLLWLTLSGALAASSSDTPVQIPDFAVAVVVMVVVVGVAVGIADSLSSACSLFQHRTVTMEPGCSKAEIKRSKPGRLYSPVPTPTDCLRSLSPVHNGQVCSTWGNFHFKTFDGDLFQLPSSCNYVLTSLCGSSYKDFNIQLRRQLVDGLPTISSVVMKLDSMALELSKSSVVINGKTVILPFSQSGVVIEQAPTYLKIKAKLGLSAIWNGEDSFMVELDTKYKNQTCGLCGDFNGVQLYNEFYSHGIKISPLAYASFWKINDPTETCNEYELTRMDTCTNMSSLCEQIFAGPAFTSCQGLLDVASFASACVADICHCGTSTSTTESNPNPLCLCNTLSEFSRQCVHAGGKPNQWGNLQLCCKDRFLTN
ncbi:Mucin-5AC [Merluccius polli]|uniref:Mucin-5AC n=1 Tax=Merluccius polli TaxID=89951 RepID=A0AA47NCU3_MERPO|nr:Mucin-5AC [Merluccius polli]